LQSKDHNGRMTGKHGSGTGRQEVASCLTAPVFFLSLGHQTYDGNFSTDLNRPDGGGNPMKKLMSGIIFFAGVLFAPFSVSAGVSVHIDIPLPPPIIFPAPPHLVVIPETYIYAVPDIQDDLFFYSGWWWRPWNGRWYRSRYYDRGWTYDHQPPFFHRTIPPGWRDNYRNKTWKGHRWEHRKISHHELQRNWSGWKKEKRWEKHSWGVKNWKDRRSGTQYRREVKKSKTVIKYRDDRRPVREDRR